MAQVQIFSVQKSHLAPISIGHPLHFGPHLLLSDENFNAIWQLLKCRRCSVRHLYHKLAARECKTKNSNPCFHSLCRAIKAVLQGLCLNRRCSTKFVVTSSRASLFPPSFAMTSDYMTVMRTSVSVQNGFVVCPSHGRELFDLLYCKEGDDAVQQFDEASPSCRDHLFIPKGHSLFFRSFLSNEVTSDDSTDEEDGRVLAAATNQHSTVSIVSVSGQSVLDAFQATIRNCPCNSTEMHSWNNDIHPIGLKCCDDRIIAANKKWFSFYGSLEDGPCEARIAQTVSLKPTETKRHAHFPTDNPVSSVRCMFTYTVASSLERRDRTWETAAQHRIFSRYCRLVSSGHDPCTASELAERSSEEEVDCDCTSPITKTVAPFTDTAPKPTRKKRRKRRKKQPKNRAVEENSDGPWGVKSNQYNHPVSIFFSSPISCQSRVPAPF